jgi:hypothetical protein
MTQKKLPKEDTFRERAVAAFNALSRPANLTEEQQEAARSGEQPVDQEKTTLGLAALLASMSGTFSPSATGQKAYFKCVVTIAEDMLVESWARRGMKTEDEDGATRN